ncbi:MAG: hypothetical protein OEO20_09325 [Gemmatimonadota bacterium]|nr:hypothetical protein [Gemmatimonadota bacterium]MDH3368167.1 hypothetical protein [Gemmatimonadota bacterium]MDH3478492.1 hypothetical protein [Gemmatimonadota bacterium]MDH3570105.1 hypothetical protein [Gemmatimonadota bacterium]MDH5548395.1 hypothetical protein [Gemmatimonadota bacterium]
MPDHLRATEDRLLAELAEAARGPKRNALFALWLVVRHCDGALPPAALSERACSARLGGLEHRLSSLSLPAPLRRALPACLRELRAGQPARITGALQQLAAPAREGVGPAAADALGAGARAARRSTRERSQAEGKT